MAVEVALTEPQEDFCFSDEPFPAIIGGLGSGKSRAGTFRLLLKMIESPGANGAYYMPTYDLLKLRGMPGLEDDLASLGLSYTMNKSNYSVNIVGLGFVIFRSYDNPNRIIAYEVAHSIVDELDTLPMDKAAEVWRKITERNRQDIGVRNTIGCVTTPDQGLSGFVYKKWVEQKAEGYTLIKAPTASNPFLPDDYIDNIRKNYDEKLAEMYISGEFVSLSDNKVYHYYDRIRHHSDRVLQDDDTVVCVSVDFNVGGCCSVVSVVDDGYPIAVDEFVSNDTYDFVNQLAARLAGRTIVVFPDASGKANSTNATQTDLEIIKGAGHRIEVNAGNPLIKDRVNSVNKLLSHDQLKINANKCKRLAHALESQGYDKKGKPEKFDNHPAIDDWTDNFGYFLAKRYPIAAPNYGRVNVKGF
jgi:PBSX family phage terminase large subunit